MKIKSPFLYETTGILSSLLIRSWMGTLEYQVYYYDKNVDPAYANDGKQRIYIFWHENILVPLFLRRNCNLAMLLSPHADAEVLSKVARLLGFGCVRGSSNKNPSRALKNMKNASQDTNLTITPDGPRGPRRKLAMGAVYLSSKLQMPLVLLGIGVERPWRVNSWDRFAIPRPFSRARIMVSGDIQVPANADKETQEHYRVRIEKLLTDLSDNAADWAESGYFLENQTIVLPGPKHSILYHGG